MEIILDYQGFLQRVGGVSRSFCELAKHLPSSVHCAIVIKQSDNLYLRDPSLLPNIKACRVSEENFLSPLKFRGRHRLYRFIEKMCKSFPTFDNVNKAYTIQYLKEHSFDIYHTTHYDPFFLSHISGKPFVVTVHDMTWEKFGMDHTSNSIHKHQLCKQADHIVVVSQKTKEDLIHVWDIPQEKISVVYHGHPKCPTSYAPALIQEDYFLYVGSREFYKNFRQTLIDFAAFHTSHPKVLLICTGSPFTRSEQQLIDSLGLTTTVRHYFASDIELISLYHHALAFIFPSIYEGFGIPILEAFTYGCVALLNNKSCFPEIGGDAAIYFDSDLEGHSNLPEQLEQVYTLTPEQRQRIQAKGWERAQLFTWEKSAQQLHEVYKQLIQPS